MRASRPETARIRRIRTGVLAVLALCGTGMTWSALAPVAMRPSDAAWASSDSSAGGGTAPHSGGASSEGAAPASSAPSGTDGSIESTTPPTATPPTEARSDSGAVTNGTPTTTTIRFKKTSRPRAAAKPAAPGTPTPSATAPQTSKTTVTRSVPPAPTAARTAQPAKATEASAPSTARGPAASATPSAPRGSSAGTTPSARPAQPPATRVASSSPRVVMVSRTPAVTPAPVAKPAPATSTLAPQDERVTYHYNTLGRRDPFQPLIGGGFIGMDVGGNAPPDVGGVKVVGIVWGAEDKFALVEDGRGNSLVLRQGDKVMDGYVESLKRDGVTVKLSVDGQTHLVTIPLTRKGEQKNESH